MLSCTLSEEDIFDFPLSSVDLPNELIPLVPNKLSDIEFELNNFQICDSLLIEYNSTKSYALTVLSINSGDTLVNLCRKGRGPDETFFIAPYYDIVNGTARIVDCMNSRYSEIDLYESIRNGFTTVRRHSSFGNPGLNLYYSTRLIGADSLLCYDGKTVLQTNSVSAPPTFSMFDLKDGHCVAEYGLIRMNSFERLQKESDDKRNYFLFRDCTIPMNHTHCICFNTFPVVAFLDYRTGMIHGIKINGLPGFDIKNEFCQFRQVLFDGSNLLLLYIGVPSTQLAPGGDYGSVHSKILQMNLDGSIQHCYELDGLYTQFQISNGIVYLRKAIDSSHLYTLDINKIS